jgi:DNA invertase Pin-like site-specific DNA recombinase
MEKQYFKNCPNCRELQTYTTKSRLECSIREKWVCNKCSSTHQKKIYSEEIINNVVELYVSGVNFSKIATLLKVSRDNVKNILKEKNVWVENRDMMKKEFNDVEINDILIKYKNGISVQKICKLYNVSKKPIQKILKDNRILKEGRSNGVKINLTEEQKEIIKDLYLNGYKNSLEIGQELNLSKSFIDKYLQLSNIVRTKSEGVSVGLIRRYRDISYGEYLKIEGDYKKYKNDVMRITNQQRIDELSNYQKRGNSGVEGVYHLDHKYSILEGFKNKISPTIIGGIKNLEFIPWEENIKKRTKNSITINELIN